ncbi:AT133-like protein [Mya arenaria]|uniref:Cation-transporting ATPase n=1 Tax=Mya arenaria TaxID=6604 RepID=A0ABY7EX83_MYAAR|nr:AT133-like protein [Mya arenaria]
MLNGAGQATLQLLPDNTVLNEGTEEELKCYGYRESGCKRCLFYFLVVITLGLVFLLLYWKPELECYLKKSRCVLYRADTVLLMFEPVVLYFDFQHVRYIWSSRSKTYSKLLDLSSNTLMTSLENHKALTRLQQAHRRMLYGNNSVEVEVKSYWKLLIEEVLNPFYIFQLFSIVLWTTDQYYVYALCILVISLISIIISLYQTKRQMVTLHNMVKTDATTISVDRGDSCYETIPVTDLVPGDIIAVPSQGCTMTCDAVSLPVTKTAIAVHDQQEVYSPTEHKRNTVFAGTKVLQTRFYGGRKVPAVVIRTGFNTAKGELVRAILFPKPLGFKFYRDAMRFIMFLAVVACFGMAYSVYTHVVLLHASARRIVLRVLDVVTIIVPPALPAAMTVGTVYAQNRLKKKQIFCISPPRINFCGLSDPSLLDRNNLLIGLATCHSLTIIDGEISGDPMDIVMFKSTKWMLEEPGSDTSKFDNIMPTIVKPVTRETFMPEEDLGEATNFEVGIVHQFPFSNKLKRMSVITRTFGKSNMDVFCKGAPEVVMKICDNKTVPDDTDEIMMQYAIQGFRVMALAGKPLDPKVTWHQVQRMSRDDAESGLTFLGLLIFQNKLKPQSKPVIRTLRSAGIRTVMITGDRSETAVSVGRNCGMIDSRDHVVVVKASKSEEGRPASICWEALEGAHTESPDLSSDPDSEVTTRVPMEEPKTHLAIDGYSLSVLEEHFPETLRKVCVRGTIFSRMSPDQKCLLIQKFQELGYSVGMCGDGANDCEALKAAHAGISLSEAEASVAAPFTSAINNIECVTTLMREGRAALVTSFGCFKYMALYSFIQFISVMILYTYEFSLSDWQFLYIDLAITTTIAILSLLCSFVSGCSSLLSHRAAMSWVSTVVFIVSSYQYIVVAFCFSKGPPFRKRIYTNVPYLSSLIFLTILSTCIFMIPIEFLLKIFKYFVTENLCVKSCIKSCLKCVQPKKLPAQYKLLEKEMEGSDWPPTEIVQIN